MEVNITVDDTTYEVVRAIKDFSDLDKQKILAVITGMKMEKEMRNEGAYAAG